MDDLKMRKTFPYFFQHFVLPPSAEEQIIDVYRACPTHKIEKASFLCTYEDNGFQITSGGEDNDPQEYCMSTYIRLKDVKRFVIIDSKYQPPFLLAKGCTHPDCGLSCPTKTWKKTRSSHVDYWLYEGAEPWHYFKETNYEAEQKDIFGGD